MRQEHGQMAAGDSSKVTDTMTVDARFKQFVRALKGFVRDHM